MTDAPAGAAINAASGAFAWTPGENQSGKHTFKVKVTDNGTPALSDEETITVTVTETNTAPVLRLAAAPASVNELVAFSLQASATDADIPVNTLAFALVKAPAGATINATSGLLTWTPTEAQGNGSSYEFTVQVSDGVLSDAETFAVIVREVNVAPVLAAISDKTVNAGSALTFRASATDADLPANKLVYGLSGAPSGATINAETGAFTWTPTNSHAGEHSFNVVVSDGLVRDVESVTVKVNAVNTAPVLTEIGTLSINEQSKLAFPVSATDTDIPANVLTYSLVTTVADAKIDAATGIFSWTPTELHGPGTYTFKVKVSDGVLTDEEEFQIKVNEVNQAPLLATIGNHEVKPGSTLHFKLTASDADIPVQKLSYSANKLPTGAILNASTGEFSWKPVSGQEDSYKIIFKVSDGVAQTTQQTTITVTKQQVAAPTITYFQPASGKVGQDVVIRGTNFIGVTAVYFNNVSASFTLVNSTHIMAKVPVGAKTGKVSVVAAGGKAVSSTNFTVLTENTFPPVITGFTPGRGGVGSKVVIKGLNLKNTTMVKFGSSVANYKVDVNGVITTYVPQVSVSLPASMYISVTTSAGTATSKEQFIVTSPYNKSKYNRVTTLNAPEKSIQEIEVYPNPIIDKATINLTLQESGNYRISLFDDMGKMVSVLEQGTAEAGKSRTLELDGSKLAKGLYLIRLEHKTGGSTIKVIIDK